MTEISSAFAVIFWKDKILLFLRDNIHTIPYPNCWSLPGGQIEKGEKPIQALKRELVEEVSYVPRNIHFVGKLKTSSGYTYLYYSFVGDDEAKRFKHGGVEGQGIGFFSLRKMDKIKLTPKLRERLEKQRKTFEKIIKEKSFKDFKLELWR